MKASILIPVYNRASTIARTLTSIANIENVAEIIVVDDCSTDDTPNVIQNLHIENLIYIRLNDKQNGNVARNIAASTSTGDILMFLDSDDEFCDGRVNDLLTYYENSNADLVIDTFITEKKGQQTWFSFKNLNLSLKDIFEGLVCNAIPLTFSSISVRRDCFFEIGSLDNKTLRHQDRDFLFTSISYNRSIHLRNSANVIKHQSKDSFSRSAAGYMRALNWIAQKHNIFEDPRFINIKIYLIARSLIGSLLRGQIGLFMNNYYEYRKSEALINSTPLSLRAYLDGKAYRKKVEKSLILQNDSSDYVNTKS